MLTYVFTRCPVPEFCPLLGTEYQSLQQELATRPGLPASEVQLLRVSIEPEHDRPDVLRAYGESLGANFNRWKFLTGAADDIRELTRRFAVRTERNGAAPDHTLATP